MSEDVEAPDSHPLAILEWSFEMVVGFTLREWYGAAAAFTADGIHPLADRMLPARMVRKPISHDSC